MRFQVLDVGHGFCGYLLADNNNVMLFDCGHKIDPLFRPSDYLRSQGCTGIERLYVMNYDQDHISDIVRIRREPLAPAELARNRSISADQLQALKAQTGPLSDEMKSLLEMIRSYTGGPHQPPFEFPGVTETRFAHTYGTDFTDTNNLSLVSFIDYEDIHLVIPGDLERAGWEKFLSQERFRKKLSAVNFFIASHHGRENGYCKEALDLCTNLLLVIFSDSQKVHSTQEMTNTYAGHAQGVRFGNDTRYVLTTRSDGTITIEQTPGSRIAIATGG